MSQNQSYFWQTTRQNVYLKRSAKLHMWLALLAVLTFATVCAAEFGPKNGGDNDLLSDISAKVTESAINLKEPELRGIVTDSAPEQRAATTAQKAKAGFVDAFTASISVILLTELGDKTFFIAAIMAMRHARLIVFSGAISALAFMTILSCVFGVAATIIPKVYTYYISSALFAIFGLKMIYDGYYMKDSDAQEELEEVQSDLRKREDELMRKVRRGKYEDSDDNDMKHKNSNSDKDSDVSAGAEQINLLDNDERAKTKIEIVGSTAGATAKYRQRKLCNPNNNNNNNNNNNTIKLSNCDNKLAKEKLTTSSKHHHNHHGAQESEVFLTKDGAIIERMSMSTYHSSPALSSSIASSQRTQKTICPDNDTNDDDDLHDHERSTIASTMIKSNSINDPAVLVHTPLTNKFLKNKYSDKTNLNMAERGHSIDSLHTSTPLSVSVSVSVDDGIDAAGQHNGELKQRLDREVSAALVQDPESGVLRKNKRKTATYVGTRIFVQAFTMTFLAEWGDRSQITTIILAASKDVYGVIMGGILGHSICTGLAVIGGRMVAAKISVRTVTIVGGIVFIGFAIYALLMPPDDI